MGPNEGPSLCPPHAMASIFIINDMTPEEKKAYDREYSKKHYTRKTVDKGLPPVKSGNYWKEYLKQKRQNDSIFKLKTNLSNRIREVFNKTKSLVIGNFNKKLVHKSNISIFAKLLNKK